MNSDSSEEEQVTENDQQQNEVKGTAKGKSCKGYLYYSSTLKSKARNPRCLGIPRSLPQGIFYVAFISCSVPQKLLREKANI